MIIDEEVFEEGHFPQRLLHRESAMGTLSRAFKPTLQDEPAEDVLVVGPPGVGKTVTVKHALNRLQEETTVDIARVRSLGKSAAGILRAILREFGTSPVRTTPRETLVESLDDHVTRPTIVVLDEADDVPDTDILPILFNQRSLSVIPICHDDDDFLARVDGRVRSKLSGRKLELDRYGVDALADILQERARVGLRPQTWSRSVLETIADMAAGVARKGIQTLRAAAELARERDHRVLSEVDIDDAYRRALADIRSANLASMPFHHQLLYELLRRDDREWVFSEDLFDKYDHVKETVYAGRDQIPIGRRARRYKMPKLVDYELVFEEGEDRNRRYAVCDASIPSPLDFPALDEELRE